MISLENEIREILEQFDARFDEKVNKKCCENFKIANRIFSMEFEDERMKEYFIWQMKLFTCPSDTTFATIKIWTDEIAGKLSCIKEKTKNFPIFVDTKKGRVSLNVLNRGPHIGELVFAWCADKKIGWVIIEPNQLERFYQRSFMLTPLFSRIAYDIDMALIHSAVVGVNGKGVILSGFSGAGKSSLSIACLNNGMQYLSDDTTFLDVKNACAYPMCSTIHLAPDIFDIFPKIKGEEFQTRNGRDEKKHVDISSFSNQFMHSMKMDAIIALKRDNTTEFGIRPVSWEKAAVPLVFSSVRLLDETKNAPAIRNVLKCLRKLPTYEFVMSKDLRRNAEYLEKFIKETL